MSSAMCLQINTQEEDSIKHTFAKWQMLKF